MNNNILFEKEKIGRITKLESIEWLKHKRFIGYKIF